ncbi:hypothetical protein ccbrp13_25810 [Ktedonobacteria bacterium brp13]|nr:hypothetical protein ccbrp13_25810 [Ktedonobacteria bacterium brp13]
MLETTSEQQEQAYASQLQRRIIRLLLQHDAPLLRNQFRLFFAQSALPQLPLLQHYDNYIKLQMLSNELLDDILPRIRRQLSLKTDRTRLQEETPTRGTIDWARTLEQSWVQTPGQPPQRFETQLRQQSMETPENILVVAILLAYRQAIQQASGNLFTDEELNQQEKQALIGADERAERELAAAYARALLTQAKNSNIATLIQYVTAHQRPGPSPYRDLIHWWQRFSEFHIGRASAQHLHILSTTRDDEKTAAWLYELWIALEFLHLLQEHGTVQASDTQVATDLLQYTFSWQGQRYRFLYNRQLNTSTSYQSDWEHGPTSRPDYTIERATPLEVRHNDRLIWREPSVILDAKYYLSGSDPTNTHEPIKKLLGDMTLLRAQTAALFFPRLPEPAGEQQSTRIIRRSEKQYNQHIETQQIHLYHLDPLMPFPTLQARLRAILTLAIEHLPQRPAPVCQGTWLDADTTNANQYSQPAHTILCPKPHIGPNVFDLVNADTDCLKNPYLCHVIGQPIVQPYVQRVTTQKQLTQHSTDIRSRSDEQLQQAEAAGNEEYTEQIRKQIFNSVGHAVEQYVSLAGTAQMTQQIEEKFASWVFGTCWEKDPHSLAANTRHTLISGEYVWQQYQEVTLQDWAAPAIQYCRALEFELKRRLHNPSASDYPPNGPGFTLGTVDLAYRDRNKSSGNGRIIWRIFLHLVKQSNSDPKQFEELMRRIHTQNVKDSRNSLAHGGAITKETAQTLREIVIGDRSNPGILCWLAEHLVPAVD